MEKRKVQLIKKADDSFALISIDDFNIRYHILDKPSKCEIILQNPYGWWVHERIIEGGASDGIGDNNIVREFSESDAQLIMNNGGICYIKVDNFNEIRIPKNGRGEGKIEIFI